MLTQDRFVALLEKRAQDSYSDPAMAASDEYENNLKDNRDYIHTLFSKSHDAETYQGKLYRELFPSVEGKKESGNPLMKVARESFLSSIQNTRFMKIASPIHIETAFRSFINELENINS